MRLGVHVPVSRGLLRAARRAHSLRCECIQIFARNPRGWRARHLPEDEVAAFRDYLERHRIRPLVIHANYLANLPSPDRALRERSLRAVADDIARGARLGARFLVLHPGHHVGAGAAAGLRTLAAGLRSLLAGVPDGLGLLLENTAGRRTELGGDWDQLAAVLDHLGGDERVGLCFDTCHAHAAGHPLDTPRWVGRTLHAFKASLGIERLRLVHLNDCRGPAGARRDLHDHIGRGAIGSQGFRAFLRRREFRKLCAILETPIQRPGDDRRNLARARRLRNAPRCAGNSPAVAEKPPGTEARRRR